MTERENKYFRDYGFAFLLPIIWFLHHIFLRLPTLIQFGSQSCLPKNRELVRI